MLHPNFEHFLIHKKNQIKGIEDARGDSLCKCNIHRAEPNRTKSYKLELVNNKYLGSFPMVFLPSFKKVFFNFHCINRNCFSFKPFKGNLNSIWISWTNSPFKQTLIISGYPWQTVPLNIH